jgi:pteridine reductase
VLLPHLAVERPQNTLRSRGRKVPPLRASRLLPPRARHAPWAYHVDMNTSPKPPVALVTGSGKRRVGWHIAQALARRRYSLAVHYHTSAAAAAETVAEFRRNGTDAEAFGADLSDEIEAAKLVQHVLDRFGRIDVLVNAAAIWRPQPLESVTAAEVRRNFEVNTLGTFVCCQQVGLAMVRQETGGSIITIGDWATVRPYKNYAAYFPSKGAIPTLTRSLAVELGTRNPNVRVNCILPGPVMLPPELPEKERNAAIAATLVKREGNPDHVALAVLHFIDNDFITGASLPVDGGRTIFAPDSDR